MKGNVLSPRITSRKVANVGFLLVPGFALLTYAAAVEPLRAANQLAGKTLYRWWHAAPGDKPAIASNGAAVLPDFKFGADLGSLDLLLVCAGGNPAAFKDKKTFAWLRKLASRGVIIGGISGGPFLLANAGLLEGRRATVHWEHIPAFAEMFPQVELTRCLFEFDRDRLTCGGAIAALDMMVALIEQDQGHELAAAVSDWFLYSQVRNGVGPQRMDLRFRVGATNEALLRALQLMEDNIETPIPREELAHSAGVSLRRLERVFQLYLGRGIHEHYLLIRLQQAQRLLRESSLTILEIAVATGFGSSSQFSRAFRRVLGHAPRATRAPAGN